MRKIAFPGSPAPCPRAHGTRLACDVRRDHVREAFSAAQRWDGILAGRELRCRLGAGLPKIAQGRTYAARGYR